MDIRVFTIEATSNSNLEELTDSAKRALNEIYEYKGDRSLLVLRCEHVDDRNGQEALRDDVAAWEKVLRQIEMANSVIIYSSEGDVFGHSLDLLLIADFRILRNGSQLGFSRRMGAPPPGMSLYRLANQVGQAQARRLSFAGTALEADEAHSLGLADELSNDGAQAVDRAVSRFKNSSSSDVAIRRRLLLEAHTLEYDDALGAYWAARARSRSGDPALKKGPTLLKAGV